MVTRVLKYAHLRSLGAADNATHKIYIWDIANEGQFAAVLDGGREPLIHVHVRLGPLISYLHLRAKAIVIPSGILRSHPLSPPQIKVTFLSGIAQHQSGGVLSQVDLRKWTKM